MNYMGGKHRQGPKIAEFAKAVLKNQSWYVEPFCGAMGVAYRVNHNRMILSDISRPLMAMWSFFQNNPDFELPDLITEDEYKVVKSIRDPDDWRTAYYGFGMSFGSKYFGGYARNGVGTQYAVNLKRSTLLKRSVLFNKERTTVSLFTCSYDELPLPPQSVIYADPPYFGRTKAHDFTTFDHGNFWQWCRDKVFEEHVVLVTEFTVPEDFVILHDFKDTVVRHHSPATRGDGTREVLVCHESQRHMWV